MIQSILVLFTLLLTSCTSTTHSNPLAHTEYSHEEIDEHYFFAQQVYGGEYQLDIPLKKYVKRVGQNLVEKSRYQDLNFEFVIVNSSVPQAWALPGGKIGISRGLLVELNNEGELASVLAREIVHSQQKQPVIPSDHEITYNMGPVCLGYQRIDKGADVVVGAIGPTSTFLNHKHLKRESIEADLIGINMMVKAGYDPKAMANVQERFMASSKKNPKPWSVGLFARHPPVDERLKTLKNATDRHPPGGEYDEKSFLIETASLNEKSEAYVKLQEGYEALMQNNITRALRLADEGIELEPRDSHFYLLKGKAYTRIERLEQALDEFNQAVILNPAYFDNYLQRGLLRERLEDYKGSYSDLQMSLSLLPTAEAYYTLGEMDYRVDNTESAIEHYRQAALSSTLTGKKALECLNKLNVPIEGPSSISVDTYLLKNGCIGLSIENKGNTTHNYIVIDIEQLNPNGEVLYRNMIEMEKPLKPFEKREVKTNVGPYYSASLMKKSTITVPVYSE